MVSFVSLEVAKKQVRLRLVIRKRPYFNAIVREMARKRANYRANLRAIRTFSRAICGTISLGLTFEDAASRSTNFKETETAECLV